MVQKAGLRILRSYDNQNIRSFAELCKEAGYPTDLGGYYLRQLLQGEYLSKGERGEYILTAKGRKYLTQKHIGNSTPRIHVLIVPAIDSDVVVLDRLRQPFLNRKEWPATAINAGESKKDAANRLLSERLAKADSITFKGVFRRLDYYEDELFDDKVFFVHSAKLTEPPQSEITKGRNLRISTAELSKATNKSRSLLDIFNFLNSNEIYEEHTYELTYKDFEPKPE